MVHEGYEFAPQPAEDWHSRLERILTDLTITKMIMGLLFVFLVGFILVWASFKWSPDTAQESLAVFIVRWGGMGLLVAATTTGLLHLVVVRARERLEGELNRFLTTRVTEDLSRIQQDLLAQTERLESASSSMEEMVKASTSLEALQRTGVSQAYASWEEASRDIVNDLTDRGVSRIRIAGISLKTFVEGKSSEEASRPWEIVREYLLGRLPLPEGVDKLHIEILIIHPDCEGAQLRSKAETRFEAEEGPQKGKLEEDVHAMIEHLVKLERSTSNPDVSLTFRLYSLPPILSLFSTDKVSYAYHLYFWQSRDRSALMPVIACRDVATRPGRINLHRGLQAHFEWIWEKASIPSADFVRGHVRGVDRGLAESGALNVFKNAKDSEERVMFLLSTAVERLDIQGISLRSYFHREGRSGDRLVKCLREVISRDSIPIRALVLDPKSVQAQYWSFREYLLDPTSSPMDFEKYKAEGCHYESDLYKDAITNINIMGEFASKHRLFTPKLYDCASTCFVLVTDGSALIEQYHFGKDPLPGLVHGDAPRLAGDLTRYEYARSPSSSFDVESGGSPYQLLSDHFAFVFERCARPLSTIDRNGADEPSRA